MMPGHLFRGSTGLDISSAQRADVSKQNFSVCPRHWYLDAKFDCVSCGCSFVWTAAEQKTWFEHYRFWVNSQPRHCRRCAAKRRHLAQLRKEYDAIITAARERGASDEKRRVIQIVDELEAAFGVVPEKMREARRSFSRRNP